MITQTHTSPDAEARAIPQQARSIKNYHRVLDAADKLFAKFGVPDTQMAQIIDESGVSAGSLYRFFPNKLAIAYALAERHREAMGPMREGFTPVATVDEALVMIDLAVDVILDHQERNPGYRAVAEYLTATAPGPVHDAREEHIQLFMGLVSVVARDLPPGQARRTLDYMSVIIDSLLKTNAHSADDRERQVVELKRVLRTYVRDVLENPNG